MKHPNAAAGSGGGAVATLAILVARQFGVELDPVLAAGIATAAAGLVLLVGRRGVVGIARTLWRGQG